MMAVRVRTSTAMPISVLMTANALVPASMQRRALSWMLVWLGESLVISGFCVTLRHAATTRADISGSLPKVTPPSLTLGHEMLISIASMGLSSKRATTSMYSSMVEPEALAMKRVSVKSSVGRMRSTTWSAPGFCNPMALSMPMGVSYTRCGLLPRRALPVVPLRHTAPTSRLENPDTRVYSSPKPTQPDSSTIGETKSIPQKSLRREGAGATQGGGEKSKAGEVMGANYCRFATANPVLLASAGGHARL